MASSHLFVLDQICKYKYKCITVLAVPRVLGMTSSFAADLPVVSGPFPRTDDVCWWREVGLLLVCVRGGRWGCGRVLVEGGGVVGMC